MGLQSPAGHPRAVRAAGGRAQAHRPHRLLVGRPGVELQRRVRGPRGQRPPALAQGARGQDDRHRPLSQPHPGAAGRQVVLAAAGHRRVHGPGHRLHLAHRGHVRQGVHRRAAPPASTSGRTTCSARPTTCPRPRNGPRRESNIPAREIRALAREWASKKTMLAAGGPGGMGGASRASWGNEWARTMVALAAMQGMGKPGSNIWGTTSGAPVDCSFMFPGYAEGGISGDMANSAAGFRFANRMFPNGGRHHQPASHHRRPDRPASAHPRGHAARDRRVAGQGLLRLPYREPVPEVRVPGPGLSPGGDVLPVRRLVLRHHDRDQPLRDRLSRGQDPVRSQPGHLVRRRDQVRRHHPAGLHQLRALGHQRGGQLLGLHRRFVPVHEPPGDHPAAEVHRAAGRVQVRLRDLRRAGRAPGRVRRLHHGRQERTRLGQGLLPRHRHAQGDELGRFRQEGLLRGPRSRARRTAQTRPALVRRRPARRTPPTGARRPWDQVKGEGLQTHERQDRVRGLQPQAPRSHRHRRPGAAGDGPAVHRELGGTPHRRSLRQVSRCRWSRPIPSSASTPWATPKTAG